MTPAALSLDHLLWDNAALHPDRVALIDADQPVSYGALADRAGEGAAEFLLVDVDAHRRLERRERLDGAAPRRESPEV